jgi:hypothetical protein
MTIPKALPQGGAFLMNRRIQDGGKRKKPAGRLVDGQKKLVDKLVDRQKKLVDKLVGRQKMLVEKGKRLVDSKSDRLVEMLADLPVQEAKRAGRSGLQPVIFAD